MPHVTRGPRAAPPADRAPAVRRELVGTWALAIACIGAAWFASSGLPLLRANVAGVAAFVFIVLPDRRVLAAGASWRDHGVPWFGWRDPRTWAAWARGAGAALAACAVVFPPFLAGYWGLGALAPHLPAGLRAVAPDVAAFRPRLPDGFALLAATQLLVVALPEELFYRGWMQARWASTAPDRGVTVLGARLGRGFVATQALFALGHLVVPSPARLATFFPGLLFGWLRARTGSIAAPVVAHALSNLFLAVLQASFS